MENIIEFLKFYENKKMDAIENELLEKAKRHFEVATENLIMTEKILKELIERGKKNEI